MASISARPRSPNMTLERNVITLPGERTKNKRAHIVPLAPTALALLASLPRTGESVFGYNNSHYFGRFRQIAGVTGFPNQFFDDLWVVGFWRADHGGNEVKLGRRSWTLAQTVLGSLGSQGAAADVSALCGWADRAG